MSAHAAAVAVLSGGITDVSCLPADCVYLRARADRFTNALWVYRAGRVRRIIVSGGQGAVGPQVGSEAHYLATLLRLVAAPPVGIWLEARSRNIRENAQFTKQLLRRRGCAGARHVGVSHALGRRLLCAAAGLEGRLPGQWPRAHARLLAATQPRSH